MAGRSPIEEFLKEAHVPYTLVPHRPAPFRSRADRFLENFTDLRGRRIHARLFNSLRGHIGLRCPDAVELHDASQRCAGPPPPVISKCEGQDLARRGSSLAHTVGRVGREWDS